MTAIPASDLEGEGREKALERLLYALKGDAARGVDLMEALRVDFYVTRDGNGAGNEVVIPHTAFVEFYNLLIRVERFFAFHGFTVRRGGTPFSKVWIEPFYPAPGE